MRLDMSTYSGMLLEFSPILNMHSNYCPLPQVAEFTSTEDKIWLFQCFMIVSLVL